MANRRAEDGFAAVWVELSISCALCLISTPVEGASCQRLFPLCQSGLLFSHCPGDWRKKSFSRNLRASWQSSPFLTGPSCFHQLAETREWPHHVTLGAPTAGEKEHVSSCGPCGLLQKPDRMPLSLVPTQPGIAGEAT